VNVTIDQTASKPCEIDATISPFAVAYNYIAQCKNIDVSNNSLAFIATSDTLTAAGNVTIKNEGIINMTAGGKIELWGNWDDQVSTNGKVLLMESALSFSAVPQLKL
jgi:hypothetical protein